MHLLCCALIIAFNLVLLASVDHIKIEVFSSLYIMSSETATNFLFCVLSEHITTSLSKISNVFYGSLWYHLPPRHQKLITLAMARSQQEFHLEGLAIISCSLETFGKVICFGYNMYKSLTYFDSFFVRQIVKTACSYFLMFRRF